MCLDYASVEEEIEQQDFTPYHNAPIGMFYLPVVPNDKFEIYEGISYTRDGIVQAICALEIYRPTHNIAHRWQELQEPSLQLCNGKIYDREFISPI